VSAARQHSAQSGDWFRGACRPSPTYLIESDSRFTSGAQVERSDISSTNRLRASNPGNWHPIEWDELLDGRLVPWAMATAGDRIISICHTPRPMTDIAAECGVWTDPDDSRARSIVTDARAPARQMAILPDAV
jgi:hypothetical protein